MVIYWVSPSARFLCRPTAFFFARAVSPTALAKKKTVGRQSNLGLGFTRHQGFKYYVQILGFTHKN
jgi:hypothetical protein